MNKADFKIVFLGTPDFAVESLKNLVEHEWNVVAVVTAPDKPAGRGRKVLPSPVKVYADGQDIPVLQPVNLKNPEFIARLKSFDATLQVVVAFRMLPREVWQMPPRGTFNLHASLLPEYRGAAPINWALINGETETGLTTFFLEHEIDQGKIILQEKEPILPDENATDLHERLKTKGARLVEKTVSAIFSGRAEPRVQRTTGKEALAPKLSREICQINWSDSSGNIINLIRGLAMYPGAWTVLHGTHYKIYRAKAIAGNPQEEPGTIKTDNKNFLHITTYDGIISILEIQKEGKKTLGIKEFLAGNKL